jgi:hypothetical protein
MKGTRKNIDEFINPKAWHFVQIQKDTTYVLRSTWRYGDKIHT